MSRSVREFTLTVGFAGLVMLLEELRGTLVHPGRPVVNASCVLTGSGMPTLVLLVLVVGFAHAASVPHTPHPQPRQPRDGSIVTICRVRGDR